MQKKAKNGVHPIVAEKKNLTSSQRAADKLTTFMGSWEFITLFLTVLVAWMLANTAAWIFRWDPYPFILLNLVLSTLAAIQAPIILMSQNRQTERDRISANYDYAVNRKAERGIENIQKELSAIKRRLDELKT